METEIKILMEQNARQGERMDNIVNQLDQDRKDIDLLRIDQSTIKESQQAILNQMVDFKKEIRDIVRETIKEELPKSVKKAVERELQSLSLTNPKKVFVKTPTLLEIITNKWKQLFHRNTN